MSDLDFSLEGFAAHSNERAVYVRADYDLWTRFQEGAILAQDCKESRVDVAMCIGAGSHHNSDTILLGSDSLGLYDALCAVRDTVAQALAAYEQTGAKPE